MTHVGAAGKISVPLINTVVQGSLTPVHVVTQAGVGTVHGLAEIDIPAVVAEARVNPSVVGGTRKICLRIVSGIAAI